MVETEKKFIIEIRFNNFDELETFERQFRTYRESFNTRGDIKPVKIENRGNKTKLMHQKIKDYLKDNPNEKYKDVLKKVKTI